jgi:pimeloyl-ACP methyl ester carboxylesterase
MLRQHTSFLLRHLRRSLALGAMTLAAGCSVPGPATTNPSLHDAQMRHSIRLSSGDELSYLDAGNEGGQPVIFVHGTPGEAMGWLDYMMAVPKGMRYIAIDRPGFGKSGPDGAVTTLTAQADAIAQLAFALKLEPAILVGHSLGGPVVARFAADHPRRTAALVILAGSLDPAQEDVPWIQHAGDAWPIVNMLPRAIRNANREIIALEAELREMEPLLGAISVPVFVLHGTADDLVPYANVAFMQSRFTAAKKLSVLQLHDQNHFLPWNEKRRVGEAIRTAADRVATLRTQEPDDK